MGVAVGLAVGVIPPLGVNSDSSWGISSSALLLGERLGSLQMVGAALVMAGLLINVWGGRLLDSWRQREPTLR